MMIKLRRPKSNSSESPIATTIEAFPGYGRRLESGGWKCFVSGVAYQLPRAFSMRQRMMIRMLGNAMQATPEQLACDMFQRRVTPFLAEAEQKRAIVVTIGDQEFRLRKRTYRNGHFRDAIEVSDDLIDRVAHSTSNGETILPCSVAFEEDSLVSAEGVFRLIRPGGVSVISDIDDTIKVSGVGDRKLLLANTFLRRFESVEGMASLYQRWSKSGASFHYVSSSPWQLYEALLGLHNDLSFPAGTMHLRNFRLRDQLFKKFRIRRHGKVAAIRTLMKSLPQQQFVLIGDSGEKDPEIYGKICRRFPGRVRGLFIRDLPHRRMSAERWNKLQPALPSGVCKTFVDAAGLKKAADGLIELAQGQIG